MKNILFLTSTRFDFLNFELKIALINTINTIVFFQEFTRIKTGNSFINSIYIRANTDRIELTDDSFLNQFARFSHSADYRSIRTWINTRHSFLQSYNCIPIDISNILSIYFLQRIVVINVFSKNILSFIRKGILHVIYTSSLTSTITLKSGLAVNGFTDQCSETTIITGTTSCIRGKQYRQRRENHICIRHCKMIIIHADAIGENVAEHIANLTCERCKRNVARIDCFARNDEISFLDLNSSGFLLLFFLLCHDMTSLKFYNKSN